MLVNLNFESSIKPGVHVIKKFQSSIAMQCWNEALWLVVPSRVTFLTNQSALFQHSTTMLLWNLLTTSVEHFTVYVKLVHFTLTQKTFCFQNWLNVRQLMRNWHFISFLFSFRERIASKHQRVNRVQEVFQIRARHNKRKWWEPHVQSLQNKKHYFVHKNWAILGLF